MQIKDSLKEFLLRLEENFLMAEVRRSPEEIARRLSEDFIEFGSSGRIYDKKEVIEELQREFSGKTTITDFKAAELAPGVILVTYRAAKQIEPEEYIVYSLRSSIWKFIDERWQIIFHQRTPLKY